MKLFWKFFFSIMIVTQVCFSIGGYVLIQYNFQNTLHREIDYLYSENDTLYYLFYDNLMNLYERSYGVISSDEFSKELTMIMSYQTFKNNNMSFQIYTNNDKIFTHNMKIDYENEMKDHLEVNQRAYRVMDINDHYYIYCTRKFKLAGMTCYIDNYHNADQIFLDQYNQYNIFLVLMIIIFIVDAIVIMMISWWLSSPIKKLSTATKKLANHQYDVDLPIQNNDEIGTLSKDFLDMAKQTELYIDQLKEYNQRQELFIGNFTHELKTPLTSIIGYADMLRSKKVSEEEMILSANQIVTEGKRLESISRKLMNLIVLKKHDFVFNHISSTAFFDSLYDTVMPILKKENIRLEKNIEEYPLYIEYDLMKTVCLNIIDNAKNAIDENGIIIINGKCIEGGYQIIIKDNGKGISQEDIQKITQAFYMVDKSRTRSHGGAGLGLAIVQEVIHLHHGQIEFESELNQGTSVIITLKENNDEI